MEQSPTGTATGDAAAKPTRPVRRMRMLRLRRARGHATCRYLPTREGPLRRGEPIPRQPGRGLVVAVTLVVVPRGYTYSRPKPPRSHSLAWNRRLSRQRERLRPSPIGRFSVSRLRPPSPAQKGRSPQPQRSDSHRSKRPQSRLPHPIALVVRLATPARGRTRSWHLPATLRRSSYCASLL